MQARRSQPPQDFKHKRLRLPCIKNKAIHKAYSRLPILLSSKHNSVFAYTRNDIGQQFEENDDLDADRLCLQVHDLERLFLLCF